MGAGEGVEMRFAPSDRDDMGACGNEFLGKGGANAGSGTYYLRRACWLGNVAERGVKDLRGLSCRGESRTLCGV